MKGYKVNHYALSYDGCSIRVYQSFTIYNFPQMFNIAINIYFTLPYYAGIMLNAFNDLLCSKLCWRIYNRQVSNSCTRICKQNSLYKE